MLFWNSRFFNKNVGTTISTISENESSIDRLENVNNMIDIFEVLKENHKVFEMKLDSYSDVEPKKKVYLNCSSKIYHPRNVPIYMTFGNLQNFYGLLRYLGKIEI